MKYKFYAEFLKNTNPFAIFAWLIRLDIKREYNHVEFVAVPEDTNLPILYYGAVSPISRQTTQNQIMKKYKVVKRIELVKQPGYENVTDLDIIKIAHSLINIKYSSMQNVFLFPMSLWFWLKKKLSRTVLNDKKEMNCTEMLARIAFFGFGYEFRTSFDMTEFEDIIVSLGG